MTPRCLPLPLWTPETPVQAYHPLLNSALKPVQDDASVANWLFGSPWDVYRSDLPRLTTTSFSNAQSLNLVHIENNDDGQPSTPLTSQAMMQLIPAARTHTGGTLGYLFSYGNGADVQSRPFGAIPGIPGLPAGRAQFHGRFVYDAQNSHFILTLVHDGGDLLSVASFKTISDGRRERTFFTFPLREYTYEELRHPSVIAAVSTTEFRTQTATNTSNSVETHERTSPYFTGAVNQPVWAPDWTHDWNDMSLESIAMEISSSLPSGGQAKDVGERVDVWDLSGISSALDELRRDMLGTFYSPAIKLDIASEPTILTHETRSFKTLMRGQLHAQVVLADAHVQAELRELAVQTYHMLGFHLAPPAALNTLPNLQAKLDQNDGGSNTYLLKDLFAIWQGDKSTESSNIVDAHGMPPAISESRHSEPGLNDVSRSENGDHTMSPAVIPIPVGHLPVLEANSAFPDVSATALLPATASFTVSRPPEENVEPSFFFPLSQTEQNLPGQQHLEKRRIMKRLLPRPAEGEGGTGASITHTNNVACEFMINGDEEQRAESNLENGKTSEEKQMDKKRRRHRQSSAAYHARQRQRFQAQASEVARLKSRTEALLKRKQELVNENQELRFLLGNNL